MSSEDGGPAFPRPASEGISYLTGQMDAVDGQRGMSLRDYFAAHALQGLVNLRGADVKHETELAYLYADEMLLARKGPTP